MMNNNIKSMELRDDELKCVAGGATEREETINKVIDTAIKGIPFVGPFLNLLRKQFQNGSGCLEARS